jgi:hypothetical protein
LDYDFFSNIVLFYCAFKKNVLFFSHNHRCSKKSDIMTPRPSETPPKKSEKCDPLEKDMIGFQPGHHCICSGASGSGKTFYTVDVILGTNVHKYHKPKWDAVVIMCDNISIRQPAFKRLVKEFKGKGGVTFVNGLPSNKNQKKTDEKGEDPKDTPHPSGGVASGPVPKFLWDKEQELKNPEEGPDTPKKDTNDAAESNKDMTEDEFIDMLQDHHNKNWKTICIIDDLMNSTKTGKAEEFVDKLFTSARHLQTDVWELTQNHTGSRTRRLNCGYLVCFATPADVKSLAHICRSIHPETKGQDILAAYRQATSQKHHCLVICLHQPSRYMFRDTCMNTCFDLEALREMTKDWTPEELTKKRQREAEKTDEIVERLVGF